MDDQASQREAPKSGFSGPARIAEGLVRLGSGKWQGAKRIGPNDPCPCGSGRKRKRCCGMAAAPRPKEEKP